MSAVTAFFEDKVIAAGDREAVTRTLEEGWPAADYAAIRVFDDETGRVTDLDYWDASAAAAAPPETGQRGRGRPRLGVTAREVTLLPRHWQWLARQPGGASAALRRLVEEARRREPGPEARRDAAYRFMTAMAGDRPDYEEALRALYRGDRARLDSLTGAWPEDVRAYLARLLGDEGSNR